MLNVVIKGLTRFHTVTLNRKLALCREQRYLLYRLFCVLPAHLPIPPGWPICLRTYRHTVRFCLRHAQKKTENGPYRYAQCACGGCSPRRLVYAQHRVPYVMLWLLACLQGRSITNLILEGRIRCCRYQQQTHSWRCVPVPSGGTHSFHYMFNTPTPFEEQRHKTRCDRCTAYLPFYRITLIIRHGLAFQ